MNSIICSLNWRGSFPLLRRGNKGEALRKIFLLSLFFFCYANSIAQSLAPPKIWDKRFGGLASDQPSVFCPLADGTFLVGGYSFSGVGGDKTEDSRGLYDYWVVKVDANGIMIWDKRYGGTSNDILYSILQLSNGKIILAGTSYSDSSGDKSQNAFGAYDCWIVEIDQNGTKIWDKVFGGNAGDVAKQTIETPDHKIVITGYSDSGISGNKTSVNYGNNDAWFIKIDTGGNLISQFAIGGIGGDNGYGIAVSDDGFIYASIGTSSGITGNISSASFGGADYLVCKLDTQLNLIWQKRFGGTGNDSEPLIGCTENKIVVCGCSNSDTISGNKTVDNHNSYNDYWSVILDSSGACMSQRAYGGGANDYNVQQLFITNENNILVAGTSYSSMGGDKTQNNFGGIGNEQTWVILFDTMNNLIWDRTVLHNSHDEAGLCCQLANGAFILGNYSDAIPGGDKTQDSWSNSFDYFMICLAAPQAPTADFSSPQIACASICIDFSFTGLIYPTGTLQWSFSGGNPSSDTSYYPQVCYSTSGYYDVQLIATNSLGADTLLIPNYIHVLSSSTINSSASICSGDTFSFNNISLTIAGNYSDTLSNISGCDSIINLQLNLLSSSSNSQTIKICDGDSIFLEGAFQTTEGNYFDTLINAQGCDSMLTTTLGIDYVNDSVIVNADTLTAQITQATYQWYNCDSSLNINGATQQTFVATTDGNYAVWIKDGEGCTKLSDCIYVDVLGINDEPSFDNQIKIYPNPTTEQLIIEMLRQGQNEIIQIEISDVMGRIIYEEQSHTQLSIIHCQLFPPGVYFIKLQMQNGEMQVMKFVKE